MLGAQSILSGDNQVCVTGGMENMSAAPYRLTREEQDRVALASQQKAVAAIEAGHPIGASGARILVTRVHALHNYNKTLGLATLCIGGGQGISMIVERV